MRVDQPRTWDEGEKVQVRGPPPRRLAGNMVLRGRLGAKKVAFKSIESQDAERR